MVGGGVYGGGVREVVVCGGVVCVLNYHCTHVNGP